MQERNTFAHRSRNEGKMHACGHDGHTAMLLGAARYLADHRDFDGTVYLIFQPAEEGFSGAKKMIDDGLRSEEHTSELQSLMRISYAVFCLKKKKNKSKNRKTGEKQINKRKTQYK